MDYQSTLDYLYTFIDQSAGVPRPDPQLNLMRTRALLEALGNPQEQLRCVVVAGTKGKGSTSAMIESIVRAAGLRTGLWTSPHLHTYRERIQIDRQLISEAALIDLVELARPHIEAMRQGPLGAPSTFAIGFGLALRYFADQAVDLAIFEVGLGGRFDSANVVTPLVSVITSISYDHMELLGNTLTAIAGDKAGILKPGVPGVTIAQQPEAMAAIEEAARAVGAPLFVVEESPEPRTQNPGPMIQEQRNKGTKEQRNNATPMNAENPSVQHTEYGIQNASQSPIPNLQSPISNSQPSSTVHRPRSIVHFNPYDSFTGKHGTALGGTFQRDNARLAVGAVLRLRDAGLPIGDAAISTGLAETQWPARFEIIEQRESPPIVIDGAHNGDSAARLIESLGERFPGRRAVLVFGASRGKDMLRMLAALAPATRLWVLTRSEHPRAQSNLDGLRDQVLEQAPDAAIQIEPDPVAALRLAQSLAQMGDVICVTGSLFVAAAAREALGLAEESDPQRG